MFPTSLPGGSPSGITAARPTSARAASAASRGMRAASSGVRPPSSSSGTIGTTVGDEHEVLHRRHIVERTPPLTPPADVVAPPSSSRSWPFSAWRACAGDDDDTTTSPNDGDARTTARPRATTRRPRRRRFHAGHDRGPRPRGGAHHAHRGGGRSRQPRRDRDARRRRPDLRRRASRPHPHRRRRRGRRRAGARDRTCRPGTSKGCSASRSRPTARSCTSNYTDPDGDTHVDEYTMDGDVADPATRRELLVRRGPAVPEPQRRRRDLRARRHALHHARRRRRGRRPAEQRAQNLGDLFGKILRIDPTPGGDAPYTIPADNPFVGQAGARPEIWMYGLRNPWRFSFDRETDDVWIGDVGQNAWEEIDFTTLHRRARQQLGLGRARRHARVRRRRAGGRARPDLRAVPRRRQLLGHRRLRVPRRRDPRAARRVRVRRLLRRRAHRPRATRTARSSRNSVARRHVDGAVTSLRRGRRRRAVRRSSRRRQRSTASTPRRRQSVSRARSTTDGARRGGVTACGRDARRTPADDAVQRAGHDRPPCSSRGRRGRRARPRRLPATRKLGTLVGSNVGARLELGAREARARAPTPRRPCPSAPRAPPRVNDSDERLGRGVRRVVRRRLVTRRATRR